MIQLTEAMNLIHAQQITIKREKAALNDLLGRLLPEPLVSTIESPPFSKAAMDGYAVHSADHSERYRILETVGAGDTPSKTVHLGECTKIMTGAMMPEGTDKVLRVEYVDREGDWAVPHTEEKAGNVIQKAENLKKGDVVLQPGIIHPKDIGIIASLGLPEVTVIKQPVIGILTTGSELKNPGEILKPGQIYNSNGFQLTAQVVSVGGIPVYYGIVEDNKKALSETVAKALSACDLVLLSGGVSKGEYDYVPDVLQENGVKPIFHRVAVKPGRPTFFGRREETFVFGLPGNPVSSFVIFEVMVKALLFRRGGLTYNPVLFEGVLQETLRRRDTERTEFHPVQLKGGKVTPLVYHGSSHLNALADANGLLSIPAGVKELVKGETVNVRPI